MQNPTPPTSAHWAGQFPFNSALATHRSPFLTLSRSSRPSGVHSPPRPGLDVLPTSRLRLGERFHSGKGGSLKTAAVITVIISSSLLFSRGGAFRPHLHPGRGSVCAAAFGTRVPGAGVRGPAAGVAGADLTLAATPGLARGWASRAGAGERESARNPPATIPHSPRSAAAGAPTSAGAPAAEARAGREPPSLGSARAATAPRGLGRARGLGSQHRPGRHPASGLAQRLELIHQSARWGRPGYPFYRRRN